MPKRSVIQQTVTLPAPPDTLYDMYLDPARHAAFTGHPVTIGPEPGAEFGAFGGMLSGQIIAVVKSRLIVQSWRSAHFHDGDPDSTLILTFSATAENGHGVIDLVHVDVPAHDYDEVVKGWGTHYFTPWRTHLGA